MPSYADWGQALIPSAAEDRRVFQTGWATQLAFHERTISVIVGNRFNQNENAIMSGSMRLR